MRPGGAYLSDTYLAAVAKRQLEIPIRYRRDLSQEPKTQRWLGGVIGGSVGWSRFGPP